MEKWGKNGLGSHPCPCHTLLPSPHAQIGNLQCTAPIHRHPPLPLPLSPCNSGHHCCSPGLQIQLPHSPPRLAAPPLQSIRYKARQRFLRCTPACCSASATPVCPHAFLCLECSFSSSSQGWLTLDSCLPPLFLRGFSEPELPATVHLLLPAHSTV